jgi:hypothetical protein
VPLVAANNKKANAIKPHHKCQRSKVLRRARRTREPLLLTADLPVAGLRIARFTANKHHRFHRYGLKGFLVSQAKAATDTSKITDIVWAALGVVSKVVLVRQILYGSSDYPAQSGNIRTQINRGVTLKFIGYSIADISYFTIK